MTKEKEAEMLLSVAAIFETLARRMVSPRHYEINVVARDGDNEEELDLLAFVEDIMIYVEAKQSQKKAGMAWRQAKRKSGVAERIAKLKGCEEYHMFISYREGDWIRLSTDRRESYLRLLSWLKIYRMEHRALPEKDGKYSVRVRNVREGDVEAKYGKTYILRQE